MPLVPRRKPTAKYLRLMAEAQAEYDAWETRFVGELVRKREARRARKRERLERLARNSD